MGDALVKASGCPGPRPISAPRAAWPPSRTCLGFHARRVPARPPASDRSARIPTNYGNKDDYIPHHEPFQYYASTANPHHLPPASLAAIGTDTQTITGGVPQFNTANHQYDISDFNSLLGAISHGYLSPDHLPAVNFLKAPGYQGGHAGYSDPHDEQQFVTTEINALEQTPDWSSTAVIITYDDSDGFYDHAFSGVHNPSNTSRVANPPGPQDFLTGTGLCGRDAACGENRRCGYGPRLPFLLVSPWAKEGKVDHTLTDTSSIDKFIEDNWGCPGSPARLTRAPDRSTRCSGSAAREITESCSSTRPPGSRPSASAKGPTPTDRTPHATQ